MVVKNDVLANEFLEAELIEQSQTLLCRSKKTYIPNKAFKDFFAEIESVVSNNDITTLIFDKTSLSVFDQEAMEWYHVHWKEKMWGKGLKYHRKILPNNPLFKNSVSIGRRKISEKNPDFSFDKFDIRYYESMEEAMGK
ncbi:hypothetical protein [Tunicatimonas pelagia]|uniref:hypothetical protein n=1 Tax=Tunicatimonas pelagia TaxID=931531 RepID=UPI002665347C|nr:hypothetical protein [Tunicatimonas pelagia]WKN44020.1 hypothetical protein P0M28_03415 [Tunicatimonas pelagia]